MKYMLLMYGAEDAWTDEERTACVIESLDICNELAARGKFLGASPLQSVQAARTVRVRGGEMLVTQGPFAETTEQLGGYFLLDLEHLDEAIAVAAKLPPVRKGTVEIRPIQPVEGLPTPRPPFADGGETSKTAYMLLCYDSEAAWRDAGPDAHKAAIAEAAALTRDLDRSGCYVSAAPLRSAETATCVRVRDGRRFISDGPFTETREVLGGYYVILAESRDEAARIAARHPGARLGSVEVRPLFDLSGLDNARENFPGVVDSKAARSTS